MGVGRKGGHAIKMERLARQKLHPSRVVGISRRDHKGVAVRFVERLLRSSTVPDWPAGRVGVPRDAHNEQ